jgi:hypothetical protein
VSISHYLSKRDESRKAACSMKALEPERVCRGRAMRCYSPNKRRGGRAAEAVWRAESPQALGNTKEDIWEKVGISGEDV